MHARTVSVLATAALTLSIFGTVILAGTAVAAPSPGVNCQLAGTPASGVTRYFPEAENTNDFIGFFEFEQCIELLDQAYPDRMEIKVVGQSAGHINSATQQREPQNIYLVEVTNEKSAIPADEKAKVLLMLSIHGNEKGGREGGFRVLEDFVRNMGVATQEVTGHPGTTLFELMDYTTLLLLFPNADGWALDEPQYYNPSACPGTMYCRGNAHGADLNRQLPTVGWHRATDGTRKTLNEPEVQGYAPALLEYKNIRYAADIHGMLTPADGCAYGVCTFTTDAAPTGENVYGHFVLGLISAGQLTPVEMLRSTRLANILTERLNNNPAFTGWNEVPDSTSVWGGEFYQWSTVWDTIGYTDSGISGDWFLQDTGLNAPGMDFEMAYNHATFDAMYPAASQLMNKYHLETVRQIARAYLEAAVTDVQTTIEANGKSTAYIYNPLVLTSGSDRPLEDWAAENPHDDLWDYAHASYQAAPADYFREMKPFVANGDAPAVFEELSIAEVTRAELAKYDNVVLAGSAIGLVNRSASHIEVLRDYVKEGGNLVVTDESLEMLSLFGIVPADKIGLIGKYAGMTLLQDRAHDFAKYSVKLSRQLYEPVPLGYGLSNGAPNWYVNTTAITAAGGEVVGVVPLSGSSGGGSANPLEQTTTASEANVGRVKFGSGTVSFLGAFLPDPTQENYHPYGLESYATTYFGNLILYNMLGAEQVFREPPIVLENVGQEGNQANPQLSGSASPVESDADGTPGFEIGVLLAAVVAAGVVFRRRRA